MVQELEQGEGNLEMGMTDLQFQAYKDARDEREEALRQEIHRLREGSTGRSNEEGMTDYQFQSYVRLRDDCEAMRVEREALARELERERFRKSLMEAMKGSRDLPEAIAKAETLMNG